MNVPVFVHLMQAELTLTDKQRTKQHAATPHLVAPIPAAISTNWTAPVIKKFFGPNGLVNRIWERHGIHIALVGLEECQYPPPDQDPDPSRLRLDEPRRSQRDSIFIPGTLVPWSTQLFRSINQLFTDEQPGVVHVLAWWSVEETEFDTSSALYKGYSRATGRSGPAVWVNTHSCVQFDSDPGPAGDTECARLIAHEIGHALGLHHPLQGGKYGKGCVETIEGCYLTSDVTCPDSNLMMPKYPGCDLEPWQQASARDEAGRRFKQR